LPVRGGERPAIKTPDNAAVIERAVKELADRILRKGTGFEYGEIKLILTFDAGTVKTVRWYDEDIQKPGLDTRSDARDT